mmetsp:Transcript_66287/g.185370  ORF Transcript_66287/g.185370 Transcript_66287/m.185370 type:complete len:106 (+) Transcript_66287:408-725(+)
MRGSCDFLKYHQLVIDSPHEQKIHPHPPLMYTQSLSDHFKVGPPRDHNSARPVILNGTLNSVVSVASFANAESRTMRISLHIPAKVNFKKKCTPKIVVHSNATNT